MKVEERCGITLFVISFHPQVVGTRVLRAEVELHGEVAAIRSGEVGCVELVAH